MTRKQWKQLEAYYAAVKALRSQIDDLAGLIRAIQHRAKKQNRAGVLRMSIYEDRRCGYDRGWWGKIDTTVAMDAIVPVLQDRLRELRKELKEMPPVKVKA